MSSAALPPASNQVAPWATLLFLLACSGASAAAQLERAEGPGTLFLSAWPTIVPYEKVDGSLLIRELARQAVLVAARDGLGLATRDEVLGEFDREKENTGLVHIHTRASTGKTLHVRLSRAAQGSQSFWDKDIPLPGDQAADYAALVTTVERLARTELVEALRSAGFRRSGSEPKGEAAVPDRVRKRLGELSFVSQVAALRELHDLARVKAESAAVSGALARGYAHLGVLTTGHWSVTQKVFKARALLYAERMVAKDSADPSAHFHRAYARALAGFPLPALASLREAEKLGQAARAKDGKDPASPSWAPIIEALCHCDGARLDKASQGDGPDASLATLLAYVNFQQQFHGGQFLAFARRAVADHPEFHALYDALYDTNFLGSQHQVQESAPQALGTPLMRRLLTLDDLPDGVRQVAHQEADEDVLSRAAAIVKALADAGHAGKDAGEPSWTVLGMLIREEIFLVAYRAGHFMRHRLVVGLHGVKQGLEGLLPLIEGHRYRNVVAAYAVDAGQNPKEYTDLLMSVPLTDVTQNAQPFMWALSILPREHLGAWQKANWLTWAHFDECADDEQGKTDRWKETLDKFLGTEEVGLGHAEVRCQIARHFMEKKEWEKARPYAREAAQTGAEWAMYCACECYEGLGDWDEAEVWVRRASERYESGATAWFIWCLRTGRGAVDEARQLADKRVAALADSVDSGAVGVVFAHYVMTGKRDDALRLMQKRQRLNPQNAFVVLWTALLADEAGDVKLRDESFQRLAELKKLAAKPPPPGYGPPVPATIASLKFAHLLATVLADGGPLERRAVDEALAALKEKDDRAEFYWMAGRFLELRARPKGDVMPYYKVCLETRPWNRLGHVAARLRLRALGEEKAVP